MKNKNNNKFTILGWVIVLAGVVQFILVSLALADIENQALRILSPMSCGLFGGCAALGGYFVRRGRGGRKAKEFEVKQKDERNIAINGKAAYVAFCVVTIPFLIFSSYVHYVLENMAAAFIGYGIVGVGWLTYFIAYKIYEKKM